MASGHGTRTNRRLRPAARPGQALVEFAIVIPIFVLLVVGVFELSVAWRKHQALSDAARESVRTWVSNCLTTQDTLRQRVVRHLTNAGIDTTGLQVIPSTTANGCACIPPGGATACPLALGVDVRLPHAFVFMRPFMGWTTQGQATVTLSRQLQMRREW